MSSKNRLAVVYATVRDAVRLANANNAERIAVLELVKHELVHDLVTKINPSQQ